MFYNTAINIEGGKIAHVTIIEMLVFHKISLTLEKSFIATEHSYMQMPKAWSENVVVMCVGVSYVHDCVRFYS